MYEEHPLVRLAAERIGGLEAAIDDLPQFFEELGSLIEALNEYTEGYGLSVGDVVDMMATVRLIETPAEFDGAGRHRNLASHEAQRIVTKLYVRGMPTAQIALLLCLDHETVDAYLHSRGAIAQEQDVFAMHRQGYTPYQISKELGVVRSTAEQIVKRAGDEPNSTDCGLSDLRRRIIELRQEGASYGEIMAATGARQNQVRNGIRYGMAKGLLERTCERERVSA